MILPFLTAVNPSLAMVDCFLLGTVTLTRETFALCRFAGFTSTHYGMNVARLKTLLPTYVIRTVFAVFVWYVWYFESGSTQKHVNVPNTRPPSNEYIISNLHWT
jgi:hypothetical protein